MASFYLGKNNRLIAEGDLEKLVLIKKRKRDFDYITSGVLMEHQKHLLASLHFKAMYNDLLFVPSIGITLASGILAVLAQSGLVSEYYKSVASICIAALAAFSVFWQSLMKQLDYGGRAKLHDSAATALGNIYKVASLISREQKMIDLDNDFKLSTRGEQPHDVTRELEHAQDSVPSLNGSGIRVPVMAGLGNHAPAMNDLENQDETDSATNKEDPSQKRSIGDNAIEGEDHFTLSKQFEQALQGCTSQVPIKITAAFNALDSRVNVSNKKLVPVGNCKPKIAWEKVYPALYHQLTLTIITSRLWPYVVPGADWVVHKTINDFQKMDAGLLKILVQRAQEIDSEYSNLVSETTPLVSS